MVNMQFIIVTYLSGIVFRYWGSVSKCNSSYKA